MYRIALCACGQVKLNKTEWHVILYGCPLSIRARKAVTVIKLIWPWVLIVM